jgi:hypothetical protein
MAERKSNKGKLYVRSNPCIREGPENIVQSSLHICALGRMPALLLQLYHKHHCFSYITKGKHKCLHGTCVSQVSLNCTTTDLLKLATSPASLTVSFSVYQFETSVLL